MVAGMDRLVLASGSPRRRELLGAARPDVQRRARPTSTRRRSRARRPLDLVRRLAAAKARAVDGDPVLAADTIVEVDGEILGKPADADDARRMLRRLSGRTHHVHTGVAAAGRRAARRRGRDDRSSRSSPLTAGAVDWYLATGEPFDKAGAYAIQGAGGVFVDAHPRQRQQRRRPAADHRRRPPPPTVRLDPRLIRRRGAGAVSTLGARLLTATPVPYHWHSHRPSANAPDRTATP